MDFVGELRRASSLALLVRNFRCARLWSELRWNSEPSFQLALQRFRGLSAAPLFARRNTIVSFRIFTIREVISDFRKSGSSALVQPILLLYLYTGSWLIGSRSQTIQCPVYRPVKDFQYPEMPKIQYQSTSILSCQSAAQPPASPVTPCLGATIKLKDNKIISYSFPQTYQTRNQEFNYTSTCLILSLPPRPF